MAIQRERKEQEILVRWFKMKYPGILIVASANGGRRNIREAANMKREGVLAGFPDLQIFANRQGHYCLLIELKATPIKGRPKGKVSMNQKVVMNTLNMGGYYTRIAWGLLEAKKLIDWYMKENVVYEE